MTEVTEKWHGVVKTRRPTARAGHAVRARVVHTATQKRRLDIFVTKPIYEAAGWSPGGAIATTFAIKADALLVKLTPAHCGVRAAKHSKKSTTIRVAISGSPIRQGLCASVQEVSFSLDGSSIIARLPVNWAEPVTQAVEAA
jgi:hypothetical protein